MRVLNLLSIALSLHITSFASETNIHVDCITLVDENSIICKYTHDRVNYDKNISVHWIDPNGVLSRSRSMTIPASHGSIYDYRYLSGRLKGIWTFMVTDESNEFKTNFTIE